jgi:hypothetical protein
MKVKQVKSDWSLVCIHWRDAFDGENGWTDLEKYDPTEMTVVTVGYLIPDMLDGYVTVVNSYFPDEVDNPKTAGMCVHIPTGMVIQVIVLEQPTVGLVSKEDEDSEKPASSPLGRLPLQVKFQGVSSHLSLPRS